MDVRLQGNSQLHYGVNGGATRNSSPGGDTLKFLSREEQECLQFFEETIESLDDGLDEQQQRLGQRRHLERNSQPYDSVDGHPNLAPNIIDLVHSEPDLVHTAEPVYSPSHQDFYHMPNTPESNFEARPRHDMFPSEYNPPLRSPSFGTTDSHSSYHPPGSVPTPVLIAQQLAENQGDGTSNLHPSSLLRRLSMESEKAPRDRSNISAKHGPPPSPKPAHYPPNIHVVHGGKEPQIPGANVNIHERQEQMLAHLAGTSHPLLQDIEDNTRNSPSRSISFKDPEPDKSRMEALSKLGLTRGREVQTPESHRQTSVLPQQQKSALIFHNQICQYPLQSALMTTRIQRPGPHIPSGATMKEAPSWTHRLQQCPLLQRTSPHQRSTPLEKPPARASSPEYRRRPSSMFRPQGITVQFCGRGAMNESRREALRRLGLLKDS
uniref:Proline and serine rich 2 n=1 Tax=Poecilia formosa TaxID=48698 RepID=A0A087YGL9_POEFO